MVARQFGKFEETVRRLSLFEREEPLLVAVSGGIDSMTLLHLAIHLPPSIRPSASVIHFDHHLRGKESREEARFVQKISREWGLPFYVGTAPRWKDKSNLQARARKLRYDFFREKASELGIEKIATAHQADDQAETFLIRWIHGAGLKGLAGIRLKRREGNLILVRPLLFMSRDEIVDYAGRHRIPFREDPTNRQTTYLRNRIRKLLASLREENPNLLERSAINSLFLQADQDFLDEKVDSFFIQSVEKKQARTRCPIAAYRGLPEAIRFRLLQRMVREVRSDDTSLPAEAVLKMEELLQGPGPKKKYDLPDRIGFAKEGDLFEIYRRAKKSIDK